MIKINKRFDRDMNELTKEDMKKISYRSKIVDNLIDRLNDVDNL
jgi:mRNA-degrading endonuclease YafQ of YafQ-DinJ toxin-antitoxin module